MFEPDLHEKKNVVCPRADSITVCIVSLKYIIYYTMYCIPSMKLTYPLKLDGCKMKFPFGMAYFQGYVSFRECKYLIWTAVTGIMLILFQSSSNNSVRQPGMPSEDPIKSHICHTWHVYHNMYRHTYIMCVYIYLYMFIMYTYYVYRHISLHCIVHLANSVAWSVV